MANLQNLIERTATEAMQFHAFAKEWKTAIVAVWLLKFVTGAVSIYAGAHYFSTLIAGAVGGGLVALAAAMLLLFLLEVTNATALFKGAKFALRKRPTPAIFSLLIACATFSASYITSVQGIEAMQTAKVDNTAAIDSTHRAVMAGIELEFSGAIREANAAIQTIQNNPAGWQDGKRTILTAAQLSEISSIRAEISALRAKQAESEKAAQTERKAVLQANESTSKATGNKYGQIVAVLMFVQLVANTLLAFFYSRIFLEKERALSDADDLRNFATGLFADMFSDIKTRYESMQRHFSVAAQQVFEQAAQGSFAPVSTPLAPTAQNSQQPPVSTPANTPLTPRTGNGIGFNRNASQNITAQQVAQITQAESEAQQSANYYYTHRPDLCAAIQQQAAGYATTNRKLAEMYGCSEATVRNCRRAILMQ